MMSVILAADKGNLNAIVVAKFFSGYQRWITLTKFFFKLVFFFVIGKCFKLRRT